MKAPQIVVGVVAALALAGGGFALGMSFERSLATSGTPAGAGATGAAGASGPRGATGARQGGPGGGGALVGFAPITGRVLSVNEGSITVAAVDRSQPQQPGVAPTTTSQIVLIGASTRLVKTSEVDVKLADLKVNDQVTVVGTTDSAGLVSATAVVVGPTNILGQLFGSQTGNPGSGGRGVPVPSPTARP
jgi:hypothetical protein